MNEMFHRLFTKNALLTNIVSGAGLFLIGDWIEQKIEAFRGVHGAKIDSGRLARMSTIGLIQAPPHYYFYKYLDQALPGKSAKIITKKILLDQFIACPMFSILFFIPAALLEGKGWKSSCQEFVDKFPTVYLVDWLLWPPCQVVNFLFIPSHYRVLYVNSWTVVWNVFLSYMKHYDQF